MNSYAIIAKLDSTAKEISQAGEQLSKRYYVAAHGSLKRALEFLEAIMEPRDLATCRSCGKRGYALDEFTSPYTGICAECSKSEPQKFNGFDCVTQAPSISGPALQFQGFRNGDPEQPILTAGAQ